MSFDVESAKKMRQAVAEIAAAHEKKLGRVPTAAEWEHFFTAAIDARGELGVVMSVTINFAHDDGSDDEDEDEPTEDRFKPDH